VFDMARTNVTGEPATIGTRDSNPTTGPEETLWAGNAPDLENPVFKGPFRVPASRPRRGEARGTEPGGLRERSGRPGSRRLGDAVLVEQCLAGRKDAYEEIVRRYQHRIYRVALGLLRDPDAAEDLAQETFVRAYRNLSAYDARFLFRNWLLTICANLGKNRLRSRARRRSALERYAWETDASVEAPKRRDRDLWRKLEEVPDTFRVPLLMRHMEGLSYDEIAAVLGIGVSAAKMRVKRGRDRLVKLLEDGTRERNG